MLAHRRLQLLKSDPPIFTSDFGHLTSRFFPLISWKIVGTLSALQYIY